MAFHRSRPLLSSVGVIAILVGLAALALAGQHTVPMQVLEVDNLLGQRVGMFALKDSPLGKANPFIEIFFNFSYVNASSISVNKTEDALIEIILFQHERIDELGDYGPTGWEFCCDEGPRLNGQCSNPNRLILKNQFGDLNITDPDIVGPTYSDGDNSFKYNAVFVNRSGTSNFTIRFEPLTTGFWYVYLANCDYSFNLAVNFEGYTSWYNPYGWLPAQSYGDMVVYFVIAGFYGILLIVWTWRLIVYRKDLQLLQHFTTALIILGLLDMLLWGETYANYNKYGRFSIAFLGISIFLLAVQYMWVRLMVLLMALGFTITRDKLMGFEIGGMSVLLVLYMVSAGAVQYIQLAKLDNTPIESFAEPLMTFFEIFFNIILIIWIVVATVKSLKDTREKGAKGRNADKAALFKRLLIIFFVVTLVIVILFIAQIALDWSGRNDYAMQWQWLFVSIWDWIYLFISCYAAWVWQPSENNARYAYTALEEVDDEKVQELEEGAPAPSAAPTAPTSAPVEKKRAADLETSSSPS